MRGAPSSCSSSTGISITSDALPSKRTEVYGADEAFCTGTMGELACVAKVDGRTIGTGTIGPRTLQLSELYRALTASSGEALV